MPLKISSYELCGLFKKDSSILKGHTGYSIVHEKDGTLSSSVPSLLLPVLLWWDKKSRWRHLGVCQCCGGSGYQEGQEGHPGVHTSKTG